MKKRILFICSIFLCIVLNALTVDQLKKYYQKMNSNTENSISYIMTRQTGTVWEYNYTSISRDYLDSVRIDIQYYRPNINDTLHSSTVLRRDKDIAGIQTDMIEPHSDMLVMEPYTIFRGHDLSFIISDSSSIEDVGNGYMLRNYGSNRIMDSIILNNDKLPIHMFYYENGKQYNLNINKYQHFASLHIPSSVSQYIDSVLIFTIDETLITVEHK